MTPDLAQAPTAGAVQAAEKEWTESREARSLGGEVNGDG